jgi:hypothetical protein
MIEGLDEFIEELKVQTNSRIALIVKGNIMGCVAAERERCAKIAEAHKGSYTHKATYKTIMRSATPEAIAEIRAEERGEDIASEIIARNIRGA